jgi:hypothetical protein
MFSWDLSVLVNLWNKKVSNKKVSNKKISNKKVSNKKVYLNILE